MNSFPLETGEEFFAFAYKIVQVFIFPVVLSINGSPSD